MNYIQLDVLDIAELTILWYLECVFFGNFVTLLMLLVKEKPFCLIKLKWKEMQLYIITKIHYTVIKQICETLISTEMKMFWIIGEVCSRKTDQLISHPYNCSLLVECKGGVVSDILGACRIDQCFDAKSDQCLQCSLVGGCSLTGIKSIFYNH